MTTFVLDIVIMISLGIVVFMIARSLPRVDDKDLSVSNLETPRIVFYLEKADERVRVGMEKMLRRVRVGILKLDNKVSDKLDSYKSKKEKRGPFPLGDEDEEGE